MFKNHAHNSAAAELRSRSGAPQCVQREVAA